MAPVYKFSNVGGFTSKTFYTSILAGNPKFESDNGSVFPLGEFTLASAQSSITFSNIPQTYTHLQIRGFVKLDSSDNDTEQLLIQFNSDTGTTYSYHNLMGNGASVFAEGAATVSNPRILNTASNNANMGASNFGVVIIDILDYKNINKYKTVKSLGGFDRNGGGWVALYSASWRSTDAITSIKLISDSGNLMQFSNFALYGVLA